MAYLFNPDVQSLTEAGLHHLGAVPFILNGDLTYSDEVNRYLRERALGRWDPLLGSRSAFASDRRPSENTLIAYARDLENFLTYLEASSLTWKNVKQETLDKYKEDMRSGSWAADHSNLAESTVDRRSTSAKYFLLWCIETKLRTSTLITEQSSRPISGWIEMAHRGSTGHRSNPKKLRLPTVEETNVWLISIRTREPQSKYLACKSVLKTGMRSEEICLLRANQLPELHEVSTRDARMTICYGTKGQRVLGDLDKRGKSREVQFSVEFLRELLDYRDLTRPISLKRFKDFNKNKPLPTQLFLSPATGKPLSTDGLYKAWTRGRLPFKGYSTHIGRHTFACRMLLRLLAEEFDLIRNRPTSIPVSTFMQHAGNLIDICLRPVLGHVDKATTETYIAWLKDHFCLRDNVVAYAEYLDGDDG